MLRTLDASVAAVNQGGRRKGAACVYLEPWHPDVEEFLELRDNTGEDARRTHNLNLANWVPDEFMRRVEADELWSLVDPDQAPELPDLWGAAFDAAYRQAEAEGRFVRQVKARELYGRMMRTLAQTGNGWMTFKDAANRTCNQTARHPRRTGGAPVQPVHRDHRGLLRRRDGGVQPRVDQPRPAPDWRPDRGVGVDWEKLRATVRTAVPLLDRVIDINYYPSGEAAASNPRWRPVGLGRDGAAGRVLRAAAALRLPRGARLSTRIAEEIYLTALEVSCELAAASTAPTRRTPRPARPRGVLQPDLWGVDLRPRRRAVGAAARRRRRARAAQLAADRDRADRDDRLDRRVLRVHRAAGVEPVQARDAVGGVPPGQRARCRAS